MVRIFINGINNGLGLGLIVAARTFARFGHNCYVNVVLVHEAQKVLNLLLLYSS
jgi:hypothetical protein